MGVKLKFTGHWRDQVPGDEAELEENLAAQVVDSGVAVYATVADAKEAGDPAGPTPRKPREEAGTTAGAGTGG